MPNPTVYQYRKGEQNMTRGFGNSSSYEKNIRNAGNQRFESRFEKKVKTTRKNDGYNQGNFGGKYELLEEVDCPVHGKKTIIKEYVY